MHVVASFTRRRGLLRFDKGFLLSALDSVSYLRLIYLLLYVLFFISIRAFITYPLVIPRLLFLNYLLHSAFLLKLELLAFHLPLHNVFVICRRWWLI